MAEASYYSLSFLEPRALKKETLRGLYTQAHNNLRSIAKSAHELDAVSEDAGSEHEEATNPTFFAVMLKDCCLLVECRLEMVTVYGTLANSMGPPPRYQNLSSLTAKLADRVRNPKSFSHPLTQTLRNHLLYELMILQKLFRIQMAIGSYQFKDCTFLSFQCKTDLDQWKNLLAECQSSKVTLSRTLFYFGNIYSQQRMPNGRPMDVRALSAASRPDFYAVIENFAQNTEALSVCVVYEVPREAIPGMEFSPEGYMPPSALKRYEAPKGLNSWPAIFAYPGEPPADHWPNVVSMILDNDGDLKQYKQALMYFDKAIDYTYAAVRVDVAYTLVAIYRGKQRASESVIKSSMSTIADHLRNTSTFARLRPK
ncbi:uncharacterized protein ACA1_204030 [Acanthamoeba castellanii str. Neff]|uniref:Uncharacterized protein n=1 Tax=Acanthamoeba castellanii (strain ATCC 30010 / Neff) TaxID=1257118 RepID=L8GUN6_ACACF|nr:uncharacterized protein ACA1_204030 [Acanthamoeba castellanii str. Neff]ELR16348.1 hypothetical protein ACA1_204030 [Acanthamoeba castellanii str. Neff]